MPVAPWAYTFPLAAGKLTLQVDGNYLSRFWFNLGNAPAVEQAAYGIANAREYVKWAVIDGDITAADFLWKGPIYDFPYAGGRGGQFRIAARVSSVTIFGPVTYSPYSALLLIE